MVVNDGAKLLEGETRFSYSPDTRKTVVVKYSINDKGTQGPDYK